MYYLRRSPQSRRLRAARRNQSPTPAPEELLLLQDLLQTAPRPDSVDALADLDGLRAWLAAQEVRIESPAADDLRRLRTVRDVLYSLVASAWAPIAPDALARLNDALTGTRVGFACKSHGEIFFELPKDGMESLLAELLLALHEAQDRRHHLRFKICARTQCAQVYYDHSGNRSGLYCGPRCGDIEHSRAKRKRKKGRRTPKSGPGVSRS